MSRWAQVARSPCGRWTGERVSVVLLRSSLTRRRSPLALVALLRPHALDKHEALIEYNVSLVRAAVLDIFALELSPPSS